MKRPDIKTFKKLCEAKGGNITEIAKSLNCSRRAIEKWVEKPGEYRNILKDIRESLVDLAESQLINLIKGVPKVETDKDGKTKFMGWTERPSEAAIIFTLKTRGKDRGYVERLEQTGKDGTPLIPKAPVPIVVMSPEEYAKLQESENNTSE